MRLFSRIGILKKLILGMSLILTAAISVVAILTSLSAVNSNEKLMASMLHELDAYKARSIKSVTENYEQIAANLERADTTTRDILLDLYSASYETLAQSVANQIYPMIELFDFESANDVLTNLLETSTMVKWVQYATSEDPSDTEQYQFGEKISEEESRLFTHQIKGDFAYVRVVMQVDLAEIRAYSQQVEDMFAAINQGNQQIVAHMTAESEQLTADVRHTAVSIARQGRTQLLQRIAVLMIVLLIGTSIMLTLLVRTWIIRPVLQAADFAENISEGDLDHEIHPTSQDEIGSLTTSLSKVVTSFRNITETAKAISRGNLDQKVTPRSARDTLGFALQEMSVYLAQTIGIATAVAAGDLTHRISLHSPEDMFGRTIQAMTDGLRGLIMQMKTSAEQLTSTGTAISSLSADNITIVKDVHDSIEQMTSSVTEMGASAEEVAQNVNTLSSSTEETSAAVSQMTSSIAHIVSNTANLTSQTHQMNDALERTVNSLERVVTNTDSSKQLTQRTMQDAFEGQQAVEHLIASMERIQQTVTTEEDAIAEFTRRTRDIGTILTVIQDITEQTSLLALNASIIAAQAGAQGRGFAVVADEMKIVADGVKTSTKDIAEIMKTLQHDTDRVVQAIHDVAAEVGHGMEQTHQARETLAKIISSAEHSTAVVAENADTLHDLMTTSRNISQALEHIDLMTDDITAATKEHQLSTGQTNLAIAHINEMTSQIQEAAAQQVSGVRHILEVMKRVTAGIDHNVESSQQITLTAEGLLSRADALSQSVKQFKLDSDEAMKEHE